MLSYFEKTGIVQIDKILKDVEETYIEQEEDWNNDQFKRIQNAANRAAKEWEALEELVL